MSIRRRVERLEEGAGLNRPRRPDWDALARHDGARFFESLRAMGGQSPQLDELVAEAGAAAGDDPDGCDALTAEVARLLGRCPIERAIAAAGRGEGP